MATATAKRSKPVKTVESIVEEPTEKKPAVKKSAPKQETISFTNDIIGEVAGAVWSCLNSDGPQPLAKLKKNADAPADVVLAAIGWLAREGKLCFETSGKVVTISLME